MKTTRNLWPIGIITTFALFISGTITLVVVASSQKVDLVSSDYYEQEIKYQQQLDRADRARALDTSVAITYDRAAQSIRVALPANPAPGPVSGRICLYRPSDETLDREVALALDPAGIQQVDASKLPAGLWKVRVFWTADGKDYFAARPIVVDSKRL
jgi:nitrogen fixation protein FixH